MKNDDILQPQILATLGKEKSFPLDIRTRWNSLLYMLQDFIKVHKELKYATDASGKDFDITDAEIEIIKELIKALEPLEWLVKQLCHENANLIEADNLILFTLKKLQSQSSNISKTMLERFEARIAQRWEPKVIHTMKYLENPAFLSQKTDHFGNKISRKVILELITKLLQRLNDEKNEKNENDTTVKSRSSKPMEDDTENEVEISENIEENSKETLSDEYAKFLKEAAETSSEAKNMPKINSKTVDNEMKCYECSGTKTENLKLLQKALLTIKPTSVESERAFSAMGLFATKLRNRLNDDTLNALVMMRQYYMAKK